ncbi:YiiX/YebB-like N1pC/P60 family cysteine hydrolase [Halomonas sp. SpR8]|uniref:YiiX/YebB-like N1pC/P60 family cysteine hydrolase n=1 Tax=Halomonas sp. SpR8 TaxID=3050463 RepID=UPI0027E552AA|nr:YiiX/YebB-like N1pC/P60 family cysteine hydrolase [Halomonas sp. SpR8]MDQ7728837.1 YiiX/YebB-like N1pC/P60 family cysteine hydrolase [Halomonas sp. SpR8]
MKNVLQKIGYMMSCWLSCPRHEQPSAGQIEDHIATFLKPGDVLLVEGSSRFSVVIKYLTQSSWSHAALYVGSENARHFGAHGGECFIEADVAEGVRLVGLSEFSGCHLRICRPVGLQVSEVEALVQFVGSRLGHRYDLHNIIDLARYFFPLPPVPQRWRKHFLTLGSGDPTRAICSTLIAQAFQSIYYPILPIADDEPASNSDRLLTQRHYSLFTPRDFDLSPYFEIVKPRLIGGFDAHQLHWREPIDSSSL